MWPSSYFAPRYFAPRYWPRYTVTGTSASFRADGAATAVFVTAGDDVYFQCDGVGDCSFYLDSTPVNGFTSDGASTALFRFPDGFRADGSATATFLASQAAAATGFRADGSTFVCQFFWGAGAGEECIAAQTHTLPPATGAPARRNYALS